MKLKQSSLYLLLFVSPYFTFSQTEIGLDIHSGFGLNPVTDFFPGNEVTGKEMVSQLGAHFEFRLPAQKRIELEAGLAVKYIRVYGQIRSSYFIYKTLRLLIPASVKFNFSPKWNGSLGCYLQNNRDFEDIFLHQPFNFRFDTFLQVAYQPSPVLAISVRYQRTLSGLDNTYFLNDPGCAIVGGLTCYLNSRHTE